VRSVDYTSQNRVLLTPVRAPDRLSQDEFEGRDS
jgi:hypothetical protein